MGVALVLFIAAAVAIPYFFKDKILIKVKETINKDLNATVDFQDIDISAFRHFPKISVALKGLDVTGAGDFEGVKLIHTEGLDLALNFWSVWNGGNPYEVNSVHLERPFIQVISLADGTANYSITKPKPPSEPTAFKLSLEKYTIDNGTLIYDDRGLGFYAALKGVNHNGSGEMTADVYDLTTETLVDSLSVNYGGAKYLSNAKTNLKTIVNADMKNMKFTLKETDAKINDLKMNLEGWTQLKGDDILMNMAFKAPSNNFKDFLSIIPAAYTKNYSDVTASGTFNFDGFVKGTYNSTKVPPQYPAFKINLAVQNAAFQYPKLPMGASELNTQLSINLPTSNFNDLIFDLNTFHAKLGANPIDAVLHLRTPVSDPNVDLKAKGTLNLADVPKFLPLEDVQNLSGVINMDIVLKTLMSHIDKKQYDQVNMNGNLGVNNMNVKLANKPAVFINNLAMKFTPNYVGVDNFTGKMGKSDIQASGTIDNILAFFSTNKTMTGNVNFNANLLDANEWITPEPAAKTDVKTDVKIGAATPSVKEPSAKAEKPFDRFDFKVKGAIGKLIYEKYDIQNSAASGHFTPNRFILDNFKTQIGNSDIAGNGTLTGVFDWLFDDKMLGGTVNLTSNMMDLNQFMTETPKPSTEVAAVNVATEPFRVPENIDVEVNAKMGRVLYTNMDMRNVAGKLEVKNQAVTFDNVSANTLGGNVNLKGGYDAKDIAKPLFKMAMDMKSMDFQQSFNTFNTFQKFAPIGQYLKGKFNTTLNMEGELGKDMSPNLNTLNLSGFLQTLVGALSGIKPLEEIGNRLNISELKNLDIKDTKNWIEIKNGSFSIREFDKVISKDINLKMGGTHSLTNDMNYTVKARVPRKRLEANKAGEVAGAAFGNLVTEAAKLGVNIKNSEFVNVLFTITGSALSPKVAMKVLGGDGETTLKDAAVATVNAAVDKAKDSVFTRANEKLDEAKNKAKQVADKVVDSATTVVKTKVNEAKDKAVEEAKKRAGDELGKKAGSAVDSVLQKAGGNDKIKNETDKLKDKLDKWDPFGKKKKDN
ncbi:MAG: AsmA-like C-terminal region-containing protein [Saprospiraceae bacterium]|nr:AsmA-like C-terminal region-containing protein [Saprospiraceae bacterium]